MDKKIIKFYDTEIEEYDFYKHKNPISINGIDINKIVVSNKFPFGKQVFQYFIGYKDNIKSKPSCIFFPETNSYRTDLDENECVP